MLEYEGWSSPLPVYYLYECHDHRTCYASEWHLPVIFPSYRIYSAFLTFWSTYRVGISQPLKPSSCECTSRPPQPLILTADYLCTLSFSRYFSIFIVYTPYTIYQCMCISCFHSHALLHASAMAPYRILPSFQMDGKDGERWSFEMDGNVRLLHSTPTRPLSQV